MSSVIINALMASVVLTALVNVVPRLFPGSSAEDRIREMLGEPQAPPAGSPQTGNPDAEPPFRVWFPWKSLLIGSVVITVLVNLVALLS